MKHTNFVLSLLNLVLVVAVIGIGMLGPRLLAAPARYLAPAFAVECDGAPSTCGVAVAGSEIRWTSHLATSTKTDIDTTISVWNESCDQPAYAGRSTDERSLSVPHAVADLVLPNHWTIPATFRPAVYRLTRKTGGTGTERVSYDVFFTVPGVIQCTR